MNNLIKEENCKIEEPQGSGLEMAVFYLRVSRHSASIMIIRDLTLMALACAAHSEQQGIPPDRRKGLQFFPIRCKVF
jgi:hypothetical protein